MSTWKIVKNQMPVVTQIHVTQHGSGIEFLGGTLEKVGHVFFYYFYFKLFKLKKYFL